MQHALKVFETEDRHRFRTYQIDGEPWFALADVCDALGLKPHNRSYTEHAAKLDEDERRRVSAAFAQGLPGSDPGKFEGRLGNTLITESGLFTLVLRSDKPEAKRFRKWVTSEVLPAIRKTGSYVGSNKPPAFLQRYSQNFDRVDAGHFSVINELVVRIWGRLEMAGYVMRDRALDGKELRPDISVGRGFADWLRTAHSDASTSFSYYMHKTPEWEGEARQYPNAIVPLFWQYVDEVWIPECAEAYFKKRDPAALPYLPRLLPPPAKAKVGMMRSPTRLRSSARDSSARA